MAEDIEDRKDKLFERKWRGFVATSKSRGLKVPAGLKDELWIKFRDTNFCEYCSCEFDYWNTTTIPTDNSPVIDHIKSYYNGGENSIDNLLICCWGCNRMKGAMPIEVYIELVKTIQQSGKMIYGTTLFEAWKKFSRPSDVAKKLDRVAKEKNGGL